ncbi:MAG TPA: N-acetylmuramoyl-L-alanine amidase [Candidatus Saccharimonadales bacterium]|nr:N-acetylmuramoyl-L-alanine amidase [Candidatus Saccharimonadales bacterium]
MPLPVSSLPFPKKLGKRRGASWTIFVVAAALLIFIFSLTLPFILIGTLHFGPVAKATGSGGTTITDVLATAYVPKWKEDEQGQNCDPTGGGSQDMKGSKVQVLPDFIAKKAPYVSIAIDESIFKQYSYGTTVRIPELEKMYNSDGPIEFRLVDTFAQSKQGAGYNHVDIAVDCQVLAGWKNPHVTLIIGGGQPTGTCPNVTPKILTKSSYQSRGTGTPKVIILHYTADENSIDNEYNYFNNNDRDVDVQYEVFHSGQVVQYEADNKIAHGAAMYNQPSQDYGSGATSISIENQGDFESSDSNKWETPAQITANINLVQCLMGKYNISKDNVTILASNKGAKEPFNVISHKEADRRTGQNHRSDPGTRFLNEVVIALH